MNWVTASLRISNKELIIAVRHPPADSRRARDFFAGFAAAAPLTLLVGNCSSVAAASSFRRVDFVTTWASVKPATRAVPSAAHG
jgi:hypothetical protein